MSRALLAAVVLTLAARTLAQAPHRGVDAPRPAPATGAPAEQPVTAAPPASGAPAAPAPAASGPKELEKVKQLGRAGLVKIAPKLGGSRAEKLARDKGGRVVDRAVELAAEKAGVAPRR
jgi:hypothetical protein